MLIKIPNVLTTEQIHQFREVLDSADWTDGKVTAGHQGALVKNNMQIPENHPISHKLGEQILIALERTPMFISAALPLKIYPPLFNKYSNGQGFGTHIDNAIRQISGTIHRVRTDLSATIFLSEPEEYEGGELIIEDFYGSFNIKLPAGHMVLYPANSLHKVTPVTHGTRVASFLWVQSMVRSDEQRSVLFDLDLTIQKLSQSETESSVQLAGIYHNLLRMWSDT